MASDWHDGRVVDLANPLLAAALAKLQASVAGMANNVTSEGLLGIRDEHGVGAGVRDDLVCYITGMMPVPNVLLRAHSISLRWMSMSSSVAVDSYPTTEDHRDGAALVTSDG